MHNWVVLQRKRKYVIGNGLQLRLALFQTHAFERDSIKSFCMKILYGMGNLTQICF